MSKGRTQPLSEAWAAPRILKWGIQNRIRERSERKKFVCTPTFPNAGVQASKYQYGPIEYIEICCLVVTLINIGRPRPMVL